MPNPLKDISAYEVLYTRDQIVERAKIIAKQIIEEFRGNEYITPIVVGRGGIVWAEIVMSELTRLGWADMQFEYTQLSSYKGTESIGVVTTTHTLSNQAISRIEGSDVIVFEDIVDSGKTMQTFIGELHNYNAHSITIVSMLDKPTRREHNLDDIHMITGFTIDDVFVVGCGLDYDGWGRFFDDILAPKQGLS